MWVFYEYGFTLSQITGADNEYRLHYSDMDGSYPDFYYNLCLSNDHWRSRNPGLTCSATGPNAGFDTFMDHFSNVVSQAQGAYFLVLNVMQFTNLLNRRNQSQSVFSLKQHLNIMFFVALVCSTGIMLILVYVPGLNSAFFLAGPTSASVAAGFWGVIVMIGVEELRKAIVRWSPEGIVARYTLY